MEKFLHCIRLPQNGKGTIGFNIKGEYLRTYGFKLGDKVKVEICENRIVISKGENVAEMKRKS
jgi:hypothetical protein